MQSNIPIYLPSLEKLNILKYNRFTNLFESALNRPSISKIPPLTFARLHDAFLQIRKEAHMFHEDDNKTGTVLISFLIGGIIGAGVALLLAPQSGRKTRRQILDAADDVREQASDYAKKLKEKIS
jgi:hypothetical protein